MEEQVKTDTPGGAKKPQRLRRLCCILSKTALVLLIILMGSLYWLLGTTSGSAFALRQASALLEGIVGLEVPLVDGSILYGMKTTAPIRVEVPEIVSVTADSLDIQYNVFDVLTRGALVIDHLVIPNLKVALLIDIFEESEESEEEEQDDTPFRLNIPVHIVLNNFQSKDFAFLFQVVDVLVDDLDLDLEVQGDYAGINRGTLDHLTVHLKDEIFSAEPSNEQRHEIPAAETSGAEQLPEKSSTSAQAGSEQNKSTAVSLTAAERANPEAGKAEAELTAQETQAEVLTFDGGNGQLEPIGEIPLPLIASIKNLKVKHGRYYMSMVDTGIFNAEVSAMWSDTHLMVPEIKVEHILGSGALEGKIDFRDYMYFDFDFKGAGERNAYTKESFGGLIYGLNAQGQLRGNLTDLSLMLDLTSPQKLSTTVRLNCLSSQLPAELQVKTAHFAYPLLSEELKALEQAGAQDEVIAASEENWQQKISSTDPSLREASLTDYVPEWMKLDTKKPEWITEQAVLSDFELCATGSLEHGLNTRLNGTLDGYGADKIMLKLAGLITLQDTTLPMLTASGKYDHIPFELGIEDFSAKYADEVSVRGKLKAHSVDLQAIDALLQGQATVGTEFALLVVPESEGSLKLDLLHPEASFRLNKAEAKLQAERIAGNLNPYLEVSDLHFNHLSNQVELNGQISGQSALKAVFSLNDLSEFSPDCLGQFLGQFTVTGDVHAPEVTLTGKSELLKVKDYVVGKLMVNSALSVPEEKGNLVVMSETLFLGPDIEPLKQVGLELNGNLQKHRLALNCMGKNSGFVGLEGSYDKVKEVWSGTLRDLFISTQFTRPIMLSDAVDLELNLQTLAGSAGAFELSGEQLGTLKVDKTTFSKDTLNTKLNLSGLDLKKWNEFLPKSSKMHGLVDLDCEVNIIDGKPQLNSNLDALNVVVVMPNLYIGLNEIKLKTEFTERKALTDLSVNFMRNMGRLDLNLNINEPLGAQQLAGNIKLDKLNLEMFSALGGGFNELTGSASIEGALGGVLSNPLFNGTIALKGTAEPSYDIGRIEDFDFVLRALGHHGKLDGKVRLNEGDLKLGGDLNWEKGAYGNLKLEARELPIFLLGYGVAYTNVESTVNLGEVLDIQGKVEIPHAEIRVKNVEAGGIRTSKDEIIIDERGSEPLLQEARKPPQPPLNAQISLSVKMGNDVKVEAMGLRALVIGGLEISKKVAEQEVSANGIIELANGEADLYGHHFLVNRAKTIFQGDITKPRLDCEVVADPASLDQDVVAGVHVTGAVDQPEIELFSRPVMSRNEILSYLLYGHGLEKSTGNAGTSGAELLMALGLGATTGVVNQMAGAFGVKNVSVGSSGTGDESNVGIQGYITKDIRVSYGYGLYNSVRAFSVRYEMMRRFYVEVVSSINQAVNFIYSFSF